MLCYDDFFLILKDVCKNCICNLLLNYVRDRDLSQSSLTSKVLGSGIAEYTNILSSTYVFFLSLFPIRAILSVMGWMKSKKLR